jgi:hypothetical protein
VSDLFYQSLVHTAIYAGPSEWQTQCTLHLAVTNVGVRLQALIILIKDAKVHIFVGILVKTNDGFVDLLFCTV